MADFEKAHAAMEARGPIYFAGRNEELEALKHAVFAGNGRVVSIEGEGGIGKTTLIREFLHQNSEKFRQEPTWLDGNTINLDKIISEEYVKELVPQESEIVVIDNGERVAQVYQLVTKQIQNSFPSVTVILGTRLPPRNAEVRIKLNALPVKAMMDIWASNLVEISTEDGQRLYQAVGGNPLAATLAGRLLRDGRYEIQDFENYINNFHYSGIAGPDGKPLDPKSKEEKELVSGLVVASDEVMRFLHANPKKINELTPRQFEEFVAELLSRQGYEIQLTPISRDGGKDIYAAKRDSLGTFLYIVECKKYSPTNPVGVGIIRELYGVVQEERCNGGIVATTSYFSEDAKKFSERLKYQVGLKDYLDIQKWLDDVVHISKKA